MDQGSKAAKKPHSFRPLLFAPPQGPDALPPTNRPSGMKAKTVSRPVVKEAESHVRLRAAAFDADHDTAEDMLDELCEASDPEAVIDSCQAALAFALENSGNEVMERRRDVQYLLARLRNVAAIGEFVEPIREHRDTLRAAAVVRDADTAEWTVRRMYRIC